MRVTPGKTKAEPRESGTGLDRWARPKLSVALASFNGMPYLVEQLASLGAQTQLPDELLVTDDGSTDGTLQALENF